MKIKEKNHRRFPFRRGILGIICMLLIVTGLMLVGCQSSPKGSSLSAENENTSSASQEMPSIVGLGTHPIEGTFYAVGTGLAKVISDYSPIKVVVQPAGGPNAFIPSMETGELELGLIAGNDAAWAYNGGTSYDKACKNLRVLVSGHRIPFIPLVVRLDSGIKTLGDLQGKRVGNGYGGNLEAQESISAALESVGLSWDDVQKVPVPDASSSFRSLQEGRLDATFGATPIGAQGLEVDSLTPLHSLNYGDLSPEEAANPPKEKVDALIKHLPGSRIAVWEKSGILKSDTTLIVSIAWLAASAKLCDDAAYEITKCLYENTGDLQSQHVMLTEWKQETMFDPNPYAPYHEGAVRFWKEKGLWTQEAEENHQRLLAQ